MGQGYLFWGLACDSFYATHAEVGEMHLVCGMRNDNVEIRVVCGTRIEKGEEHLGVWVLEEGLVWGA